MIASRRTETGKIKKTKKMYRNATHRCFFTVDPKARATSTKGTLNKKRIPQKLKIT